MQMQLFDCSPHLAKLPDAEFDTELYKFEWDVMSGSDLILSMAFSIRELSASDCRRDDHPCTFASTPTGTVSYSQAVRPSAVRCKRNGKPGIGTKDCIATRRIDADRTGWFQKYLCCFSGGESRRIPDYRDSNRSRHEG